MLWIRGAIEHGIDHGADEGVELDGDKITRAVCRRLRACKGQQLVSRVRQTIHTALQASDALLLRAVLRFVRQHFQLCL